VPFISSSLALALQVRVPYVARAQMGDAVRLVQVWLLVWLPGGLPRGAVESLC